MSEEMSEEKKKSLILTHKHIRENHHMVAELVADCMLTMMTQNKDIRQELFPMMMIEIGIFSMIEMGIDRDMLELNLKCIVEKNYQGKK